MLCKGDDRPGRGCIGIFLQDIGLLARFGIAPQNLAPDEIVHRLVGLMQPEAPQLRGLHAFILDMMQDVLRHHRHHFLEDLAPVLHELHVAPVGHAVRARAAQEAVVVADVVGKLGGAARGQDAEMRAFRLVFARDDRGGADIAEDEMAIAVTPFQMT